MVIVISISLFLVALISGALAALIIFNNPRTQGYLLGSAFIDSAIGSLAYGVELLVPSLEGKFVCIWVRYLSLFVFLVIMALFVSDVSRSPLSLRARPVLQLCALPALFLLVIAATGWHQLFYVKTWLDTSGQIPLFAMQPGPLYWVVQAYSLLMLFALIGSVVTGIRDQAGMNRKQAWVTAIGLAIPLAALAFQALATGLRPWQGLDLLPFSVLPAGLVIAWGVFRYQLGLLRPIGRNVLIEKMRDGVVVVDTLDTLIDLNPAACSILGICSPEQVVGKRLYDCFTQVDVSGAALAGFHNQFTVLGCASGELPIRLKNDPTERWYEITQAIIPDRLQQPDGRLLVLHDITAQKAAQKTVVDQQRELAQHEERERIARELHDSLGQTISFVNHQAWIALDELEKGQLASLAAHLGNIHTATYGASSDLRSFITDARQTFQESGDFFTALQDYVSKFRSISQIHTTLSLPENFDRVHLTLSTQVQLLRIIQEALTNARKHAQATSVQVIFGLTPRSLEVIITDDGKGFSTADRAKDGHFGLPIMKERAALLGGSADIRSTPGHGTQVFLRIPLENLPVETPAEGVRVLLVDDHPLMLEALRETLSRRGFVIAGAAQDGIDAVKQALDLKPDLVLMDVELPGLRGPDATWRIKESLPRTKVIMLSVAAEDQDLFLAIQSGADGYLLKNQEPDELAEMLVKATQNQAPFAPGLVERILPNVVSQAASQQADEKNVLRNLTPQQIEILQRVAEGYNYNDIGKLMFLSPHTVKYHFKHILDALELESRADAVALAYRIGLVKDRRSTNPDAPAPARPASG